MNDTSLNSHKFINLLPHNGEALLYNNFIETLTANEWYNNLLNFIEWQQYEIRLFGKKIKQPRLSAWYGNAGTSYTYSGLTLEPKTFTTQLTLIKQKVEELAGGEFNSVLLNLYRAGNDSMGWHSDDEKELGSNPVIASLSLGSERQFVFKHKQIPQLTIKSKLQNGSLLIMKGATQKCWQHALPKSSLITEPRINLTWRKIV